MTSSRRPKGTGSIRNRGAKWQARYSFVDGTGTRRERTKNFGSKSEARVWLNARLAEAASGLVADSGGVTLGAFLHDWLDSVGVVRLEAATQSWYRSAVERHIVPSLGNVRLDRLTPVMIERFLGEKTDSGRLDGSGGLGTRSVRRLYVTLHKALNTAVRQGLITRNPADMADKPRQSLRDATLDVWTPDELASFLLAVSDERLSSIWRLAAMTGMRRSELCGLQWSDVDLEGRSLHVRRAVVVVDGVTIEKAPKTKASGRSIDLDQTTADSLREWRRSQLEERMRAGAAWESGDWVVTDEIGVPIRPDRLSKTFRRTVENSGLRRIPFRQLRHSHATALLRSGAHPKVVQERLGHSSVSVTLDTYSAVLPNMQMQAIEDLARMFDAG